MMRLAWWEPCLTDVEKDAPQVLSEERRLFDEGAQLVLVIVSIPATDMLSKPVHDLRYLSTCEEYEPLGFHMKEITPRIRSRPQVPQ